MGYVPNYQFPDMIAIYKENDFSGYNPLTLDNILKTDGAVLDNGDFIISKVRGPNEYINCLIRNDYIGGIPSIDSFQIPMCIYHGIKKFTHIFNKSKTFKSLKCQILNLIRGNRIEFKIHKDNINRSTREWRQMESNGYSHYYGSVTVSNDNLNNIFWARSFNFHNSLRCLFYYNPCNQIDEEGDDSSQLTGGKGKSNKPKKLKEKIRYKNRLYNIYEGKRGGKKINLNGKFISIKKLNYQVD